MDAGLIVTTVLGILGQPLVKEAAQTALEKAAEAAGKAGGEGVINTLQKFLKGKGQEQVLVNVAKAPENEEHQEQLEFQIQQLLRRDPDFLREITARVDEMSPDVRNEQMIRGNNIRNTRQIMTGAGGIQHVVATGDVEGSTQEMTISKPPEG